MEFITVVFLVYSFIAFYFLFLFILTYVQNRKDFFYYPERTKDYSLSIVIPCWNEEKSIGKTIRNILKMNYKGLEKIIVVDHGSTDNSYNIVKSYVKKYPKVMVVKCPRKWKNAAEAKNYGAKFAKTDLIGFTDADSFPQQGSISKMIGFFDDEKVGVVTSTVLVDKRDLFIEKLQSIEYKVIKFSRKLLEFFDSIYVTPGPLGIFRRSAFEDVGGFDVKNLTEDIEITWHLQFKGYKIKMCVPSRVYTTAPTTIKSWLKQRNRWNIGGLQTIAKYKKAFFKKGMLGRFILPFFVLSWLMGFFGIFVLSYRIFRKVFLEFLTAKFSIKSQAAVLTLRDVNLTPNVLIFLGLTLFVLGLFFTILALAHVKEKNYKNIKITTLAFYLLFYLMAYPIILMISLYKFLKGERSW